MPPLEGTNIMVTGRTLDTLAAAPEGIRRQSPGARCGSVDDLCHPVEPHIIGIPSLDREIRTTWNELIGVRMEIDQADRP
jgi:hypothetical protein